MQTNVRRDAPERDRAAELDASAAAIRAAAGSSVRVEHATRAYAAAYHRALVRAAFARARTVLSTGLHRLGALFGAAAMRQHGRDARADRLLPTLVVAALTAGGQVGATGLGPMIDVFWMTPDTAGLLTLPVDRDARGAPAVVVVHDALGTDARSERYVAQLADAGVVVLEIEPRAISLDGTATDWPGDPDREGAARATLAAAALVRELGVDAARLGVLGFGAGARAALLASRLPDGQNPFAARALLYPGCSAALRALAAQRIGPGALDLTSVAARTIPHTLLLHGDADPANLPDDCATLAALLGERNVRRTVLPGARYGWDTASLGPLDPPSRLPVPDAPEGRVLAGPWPELTAIVSGRVAAFFADALGVGAADAAGLRHAAATEAPRSAR